MPRQEKNGTGEKRGEEREEWWRRGKMKKIDLRIAL